MRLVSILGSARKNGNTERIIRFMEEALIKIASANGVRVEFDRVNLAGEDIRMCRGCRLCFDRGEETCPLKDRLLDIRDRIRRADGLILASPVYVEDVSGLLKNWIDRMAFNCHRPGFAGKAAAIFTTSGVGSSGHALKTMKAALLTWGFHIASQNRFRAGALSKEEELYSRYDSKIRAAAEKLFAAVHGHREEVPSLYSLLVFKVQQIYWQKPENQADSCDYAFWKDRGWLERSCSYYVKHRAGRLKVSFARFMGSIIAVFFT